MAQKFIDLSSIGPKDSATEGDGAALTLTNTVRILYDNTTTPNEVVVALEKAKERFLELNN